MTKTQVTLILWTIWSITGPLGGVASIIAYVIFGKRKFSDFIAIVRKAAKESASESGLSSWITEDRIEKIAIVIFVVFMAIPPCGWIGFYSCVRGYIEGCIKGHNDRKHDNKGS